MTELQVTFRFDDNELDQAIKFLGASEENISLVKQDFFSKSVVLDMAKIKADMNRHYHTNGLVAMLITVQEEINQ